MAPRLVTASAALATLLLGAAPAAAAPPLPPGTTTFNHARLEATATDAAGDLVVVTADQDGAGATHHFYVTTRDPAGNWGAPVDLVADPAGLLDDAHLALADDGTGVLLWDQYLKPNLGPNAVWTRVRHADGSWGPATRVAVRHDIYPDDHAMAVPGHVAVTFEGDGYRLNAATSSSAGTSWRTTVPPGIDSRNVTLDLDGGLHDLIQLFPHGGGGEIWLSRLPAGARTWSTPQQVTTPYLSTDTAQLIVDAKGRELLLFGFIGHNGYRPPGDTDVVYSTAFRLLRQVRPGGVFRAVWRAPAAGDARLSQADGKVRLTWEQWKGHVGRRPRVVQLRTQLVGSSSSQKLATATQGHFWFDVAGGRQFSVAWIATHAKQLYATGTGGTAVLLDSAADETGWGDWARPGLAAVAGTQPFVAWEHGFVEGSSNGLDDSTVSVAPLP